jgi:hypothetical protein
MSVLCPRSDVDLSISIIVAESSLCQLHPGRGSIRDLLSMLGEEHPLVFQFTKGESVALVMFQGDLHRVP